MILLTGGGGYVGAVLLQKLLKEKRKVRVVDCLFFGRTPLKEISGNFELVFADIRKVNPEILTRVDTIVHLAGLSNDPTAEFNPKANFEINTLATINLAKAAKEAGVSRFVFASSCSIYDLGELKKTHTKTETSVVKPKAAYSLSKHKAEVAILKLADRNFCVTVLRKGTVFGYSPRMRYDLVVNTMVKDALLNKQIKIYGKGLQWRPLVDINDVAAAYLLASTAPAKKINKQIFNVTLDNFLVRDLAYQIKDILKKDFSMEIEVVHTPPKGKIRSYKVSGQKMQKTLGFKPKNTIETAVVEIVRMAKSKKGHKLNDPRFYNIEWMRPIFEKGI